MTPEEMKAELRAIARDDELWEEAANHDPEGLQLAMKGLVGDERWWLDPRLARDQGCPAAA